LSFMPLISPLVGAGRMISAGYAPVVSIAGAQFPVWILCLITGILVSLLLRPLFVSAGIDQWMTPRPIVYSCLALVVAYACWVLVWK
jgi:Na+/glutamate symporter